MLTRLRLQNFKSWKDTGDIHLKPITVFFGANSSGKTSLLQSLLLLRQTVDATDRNLVFHYGGNGTALDFGDFKTLSHREFTRGRPRKHPLSIAVDWDDPEELVVSDWLYEGSSEQYVDKEVTKSRRLSFQVRVDQQGNENEQVQRFEYKVGDAQFGFEQDRPDLFVNGVDNFLRKRQGRPHLLGRPVKCYGFPNAVDNRYSNADFTADLKSHFEMEMRRLHYLGPLRARPDRLYIWRGAAPEDMGPTGENVVAALLASRKKGQRGGMERRVVDCLQKLNLIEEFKLEEVGAASSSKRAQPGVFNALVRQRQDSPWTELPDVGFGVSQILPVLVLCHYVPAGSTVILEQPELHLHPSVQAGLADILVEAMKDRKIQLLVESHSEHFLLRLQRRIAEEAVSKEEVALYFCSAGDRQSAVERLDLDEYGSIRNWPDGFFGDSFGEVAERAQKVHERRRAG